MQGLINKGFWCCLGLNQNKIAADSEVQFYFGENQLLAGDCKKGWFKKRRPTRVNTSIF